MPDLNTCARLAHPDDNAAIACNDLEAGLELSYQGRSITLSHKVLIGHRFAICDIQEDEAVNSWAQPFGYALRDIKAGEYICNELVLEELEKRNLDFALPSNANFRDHYEVFTLKEFTKGTPLEQDLHDFYFQGFDRGPRGVGTRNYIAVLPVSAHASAMANKICDHYKDTTQFNNVDGVVSLAHTEAAAGEKINNQDKLIRCLSGFAIHPNIAAVLILDVEDQAVSWNDVQAYIDDHQLPINNLLQEVISLNTSTQQILHKAERLIDQWLNQINQQERSQQPASKLRIALQCGGSDAFSGISGNPLAGNIAERIIRCGGAANLAETSELVGAESYILQNCKDRETADQFLAHNNTYRRIAGYHGHTLEGNPSGGNFLRGLYNIALKSLGAAMKKQAHVRLDYVSEYGEHRTEPGYFFMDSPGNDLESTAGQVAWGANIVLFVTGNGSVTNFPFVPTLKIITTSSRYQLLSNEMDINAGVYLEDCSMEKLTDDSFALVREVASGKACLGEKAGHSQVSIWRNWRLDDDNSLQCILDRSAANGKAIAVNSDALPTNPNITVQAYKHDHGSTCAGTGLLLPTSICSGQVAQLITDQLNYTADDNALIKQYTSLVHTEGCGCSSGLNVDLLMRSFASYIQHPDILRSCLLEHGCEKVHNQYLLDYLEKHNIKTAPIGHASIQLDGGIQAVSEKVRGWFQDEANSDQAPTSNTCPLSDFIVAFDMQSHLDNESQRAFIDLIALYLSAGSTVIIPSTSPLLESQLFSELLADEIRCSLEYGQQASDAGLHVMRCTGRVSAENISGLAASGAQLICMHIDILPISGHPFVPVLQFAKDERIIDRFEDDIDGQAKDNWFDLSIACLTRKYQSHCSRMQLHQFQMSRGETGISM